MSEDAFEETVAAVRERVDPSPEEREQLRAAADEIIERAETAVAEYSPGADVMQVGSTARGTWISGDRDIDVFVRFPADLDRETLEEYGLAVGHAVLPDGHEEYAEHPYIKGEYEGFDIDLVPCFRVPEAPAIRSAVDRTPFHNEYLREHLDESLAADVRVAKQFLKGIGVYGSNLRTEGFSGYLTELLIYECGGFRAFLEAATDWEPPVVFDPEDHAAQEFDDPLVVIDPTDPERNVAAVLSAENFARLQHHARAFLDEPTVERFFPSSTGALDAEGVREQVEERGTTPVAVRFDAPDLVDDQLWPQLRRSLMGVANELERRGFDPLRWETFADESAVLFVECAVAERPAVERHQGPPVYVRQHATGFYEKYADSEAYGPFIEDDRYVVERKRDVRTPRELLDSDRLFDVALGAHVESALREEYEVLVGEEVTALAAEFGIELADYFSPRP
ncbi:CCA tRNA nucleotidyltransferase [Haloarchaeobius amylolyticus]|uniref:CCA tRNA nucleotidyltransferase n=1 Tax=Haloarchaeobius amylolyticus TaxID=1198296 RepID=UPI00226D8E42|nr:CCA tRNA nucleotidyltransferase [Haloarchaeobius amylolyticus]